MVFAAGLHSANCILAVALTFASKDTFVTVLEKKYEHYNTRLVYLYTCNPITSCSNIKTHVYKPAHTVFLQIDAALNGHHH